MFLGYDYRYRTPAALYPIGHEQIQITDFLFDRQSSVYISGLHSALAPDIDDNNAGIIRIVDGWDRECGLNIYDNAIG